MAHARRRYTGASVSGPFSYSYARPPGTRRLKDPPVLSKKARQRLAWIEYCDAHAGNVSLTCRYFGIARTTYLRWRERYAPRDLTTLEDRSTAPHSRRSLTILTSTIDCVLSLRDERPAWSNSRSWLQGTRLVVLSARSVRWVH